jgi:hypothetical protein
MYLRAWPRSKAKHVLHFLEQRAMRKSLRAKLWTVPYIILRIVHVLSRPLRYLRVNAAGDHLAHIRHSVGDYQSLDDSCCLRLQLRWKEVHTQPRCVRGKLVVFWADTTARPYTSSAAVDGTGIPGQRCKGPGSARACP